MIKNRFLSVAITCGLLMCFQSQLWAQKHQLITGHEAPGSAARKMLLGQPDLASYSQPVEVIVPRDCNISVGSQGGFGGAFVERMRVNLMIGPVYRLKIDNLPFVNGVPRGAMVYPSIELLDRLYPPEGLKDQFPVQIVLTLDDLVQAAQGKLVTKVIYLEDPKTALPVRQVEGTQSTIDIAASADPYRAADRMGRPMAIVRIGSRIPDPSDLMGEFQFNAPEPEVFTAPPITQSGTRLQLRDRKQSQWPTTNPVLPQFRTEPNNRRVQQDVPPIVRPMRSRRDADPKVIHR